MGCRIDLSIHNLDTFCIMILTITPLWQWSGNTGTVMWLIHLLKVCISLFIFKYNNNVYCANAPIISKAVGIWKGIVLTGLEVIWYMLRDTQRFECSKNIDTRKQRFWFHWVCKNKYFNKQQYWCVPFIIWTVIKWNI